MINALAQATTSEAEASLVMVLQLSVRLIALPLTILLVASTVRTARPSSGIVDSLLAFKGLFAVHLTALLTCLVLRVYRIMLAAESNKARRSCRIAANPHPPAVLGSTPRLCATHAFIAKQAALILIISLLQDDSEYPSVREQWEESLHMVFTLLHQSTSLLFYYKNLSAGYALGSREEISLLNRGGDR